MMQRRITLVPSSGFSILALTLILLFIAVSSSLSFAHIQQQRINRSIDYLDYQQAKRIAENQLDLFYLLLYDTPELVRDIALCHGSKQVESVSVSRTLMRKYALSGALYLCVAEGERFNMSVVVSYADTKQVMMQRELRYVEGRLFWQLNSFIDI